MNRQEFMDRLSQLLFDIPEEERNEALEFYENYFDDAGVDQESQVIKELKSPERIAKIIKSDLLTSGEYSKSGEYTEQGYQDTETERESIIKVSPKEQQQQKQQREYQSSEGYQSQARDGHEAYQHQSYEEKKGKTNIPLIILLCIFAVPVIIPIFLSFFGVIFGLVVGFGAAAIGCLIGGVASVVFGIVNIFTCPGFGTMTIGAGLICIGLGILFFMLCFGIAKIITKVVRWIISFFRSPSKERGASV